MKHNLRQMQLSECMIMYGKIQVSVASGRTQSAVGDENQDAQSK